MIPSRAEYPLHTIFPLLDLKAEGLHGEKSKGNNATAIISKYIILYPYINKNLICSCFLQVSAVEGCSQITQVTLKVCRRAWKELVFSLFLKLLMFLLTYIRFKNLNFISIRHCYTSDSCLLRWLWNAIPLVISVAFHGVFPSRISMDFCTTTNYREDTIKKVWQREDKVQRKTIMMMILTPLRLNLQSPSI